MNNEHNWPILLMEKECLTTINQDTGELLYRSVIEPVFYSISIPLVKILDKAKLECNHYLRFQLQVHAQKKED